MTKAVLVRHGAQQSKIGCRKCIRLAQLAERDVLRRPFPDAWYGAQPLDGIAEVARRIEEVRVCQGPRRQLPKAQQRGRGKPRDVNSASARTVGVGNTCVRVPSGSARRSP